MPMFVDQLDVPLIAISDARSFENSFFRKSDVASHFNKYWSFSENGFHPNDSTDSKFTKMQGHTHADLNEYIYDAAVMFKSEIDSDEEIEDFPQFHIV